MTPTLLPVQLQDVTRLPEIHALRAAWEQSPGAEHVNRYLFPKGWSDELEPLPSTTHWVVEDEGHLVAAARVLVLEILAACGQDYGEFLLPMGRPYTFVSRLVILLPYRKRGLASRFDQTRMDFLRQAGVAFAIASPIPSRVQALKALGWSYLGEVAYSLDGGTRVVRVPACLWLP